MTNKKALMLIIIIAVIFTVYWYSVTKSDCDVLPKDINHKIVLNSELYTLTSSGLFREGSVIDHTKYKGYGACFYTTLNKPQKMIYFSGVSKLDIGNYETVPKSLREVRGDRIAISLDGNLLLYNHGPGDRDIWLYNFNTKQQQRLVSDFIRGAQTPVWINDHQFLYKNNECKIILFDITVMTKTNINMNHYKIGALTPDGKEILLSSARETVLYNVEKHSTRKIINKGINPMRMIWFPDSKGFLYLKSRFYECEVASLYYYSLEKKRDVKLINNFSILYEDISTGFVVPCNIDIKPANNNRNKGKRPPTSKLEIEVCPLKDALWKRCFNWFSK